MKRFVCVVVILLLLGGCFLTGKKGDTGATGSSGSSGPAGDPGQDAVLTTNSYEFVCVGNPYTKSISEIDLALVGSGKQTVTSYAQYAGGEFLELPHTMLSNDKIYEDDAVIDDQGVILRTYEDGQLYFGNAIDGTTCRIIVRTYNK